MKPPDNWLLQADAPVLGNREFEQIRQLAHGTFGLDLKPGKEDLVAARLGRLLRKGGFHSFQDYYRHVLADQTGSALAAMVDALATNHTSFLRETDHFSFLRDEVLPLFASRGNLDVWCAACSTGEEVWTLAMVLNEACPRQRIAITASDISRKALAQAETAEYSFDRCRGIPPPWLARYFIPGKAPGNTWMVAPRVRNQARFERINLVEPLPWTRLFPVIFCRNVMIYFNGETQERVVRQLSERLEPGGYLFVGHAESLTRVTHGLEYVRPAIYRKPSKEGRRWTKS